MPARPPPCSPPTRTTLPWPRTGWTSPSLQETLTTLIAGTLNRAPLNPERRSSAQLPLEQTCV